MNKPARPLETDAAHLNPDLQKVNIPTWEKLRDNAMNKCESPELVASVDELRKKPRNFLWRLGKAFTYVSFRDQSYRKFINSSWEEIVDIIYTQVAENRKIHNKYTCEELAPVTHKSLTKVRREFQQQPCSRLTARKRVDYAKKFLNHNDDILLIGDDDLVSLELARDGFKHLTVVEIDRGVVSEIKSIAEREQLPIKVYQQDVRNITVPSILENDYKLVFLDPSYCLEGVEFFLEGALSITKNSKSPLFFLSVHLMSLMRTGLHGLESLLTKLGLESIEFNQSFNLYPIPPKTRGLIYLVNRSITKSCPRDVVKQFQYFTSDALLLRKITTQR